MKQIRIIVIIITTMIYSACYGDEVDVQGWKKFRIYEADSRCISISDDRVSILLVRGITRKEKSFFKEDRAIAITLNTKLVSTDSDNEHSVVSFERAIMAPLYDYEEGLVRLPYEIPVLSRFPLLNGEHETTNVQLEINLIREKDEGSFGLALDILGKISENFIPPANPYGKAFSSFATFSRETVNRSIENDELVDKATKVASFTFEFSDGADECLATDQKTGVAMMIEDFEGEESRGFVDTTKLSQNYCWRYNPESTAVEFSSKSSDNCSNEYTELQNPHLIFAISARRSRQFEANNFDAHNLEKDMEAEADSICNYVGISPEQC